jgi:hypothetical protein
MSPSDPHGPDGEVFRPPEVPILVCCLHCGEEYDSYRIEWRIRSNRNGESRGFWCCPIPGCDGVGFGCDILPVDPDYEDENFSWVHDDDEADDDEDFSVDDNGDRRRQSGENGEDDEALPF